MQRVCQIRRLTMFVFGTLVIARSAAAQSCAPHWGDGFATSGFSDTITEVIAFDIDGDGPDGEVICVGFSTTNVTAGGMPVVGAAYWTESGWTQMGATVERVTAFFPFDEDADGPAPTQLYAAGQFTFFDGGWGVARWNGNEWTAIGVKANDDVLCLSAYDIDGLGPNNPVLLAGGRFSNWGYRLAQFSNGFWIPVLNMSSVQSINAMTTFDEDGPGAAPAKLFIGGNFTFVNGVEATNLAKWDGMTWQKVSGGTDGLVDALQVVDPDGPSGALPGVLYIGGWFTSVNGGPSAGLARWNGSTLTPVPGSEAVIRAGTFCVHDDGSGEALYVGGRFSTVGSLPANNIARWDGATWSTLGAGVATQSGSLDSVVQCLVSVHDPECNEARLYAVGNFTQASGKPVGRFAYWANDQWNLPDNGVARCFHTSPCSTSVYALQAWDADGIGPQPSRLYAAGKFDLAGNVPTSNIVSWDGHAYAALGAGVNGVVLSMAVFDDDGEAGPHASALVAGGQFTTAGGAPAAGIAKWDGSAWSSLTGTGAVAPHSINALLVADLGNGPALYAAGWFIMNGQDWSMVARWDGETWSQYGTTIGPASTTTVLALAATNIDEGSGSPSSIYIGGRFRLIAGSVVNNIARWSGSGWTSLSGGVTSTSAAPAEVHMLQFIDGGDSGWGESGLYVGGYFDFAGSTLAFNIARWAGSQWSSLGQGIGGPSGSAIPRVHAMHRFGAGASERLYITGDFGSADDLPAAGIAQWSGKAWSALGLGLNERGHALEIFDSDGDGPLPPSLFVGGNFTTANQQSSGKIARWGCDAVSECAADIAGNDGQVNVADLLLIIVNWGECPTPPALCGADVNHDGVVNVADLLLVITAWGVCP